ncbi:MAG: hypothetical protein ACI8S6_002251 [Myxococcota bacterium]|jgi:uncharacterized protein (DUF1330 family)
MAHYLVFSMDITDFDRWNAEYVPAVGPLLLRHRGQIVAVADQPEPLEGAPQGHNVILRFPDQAHAEAWFHDPDYLRLRALRAEITEASSGFGAPSWRAPVAALAPLQADDG